MSITLHRSARGSYFAHVATKGFGENKLTVYVYGPDPNYGDGDPNYRWVVESDDERYFRTLADARKYLNNFFEPVKE